MRPDPDALLADVQQAKRGRLKVFLGMAPGVGKTYEMLNAARAQQAKGQRVLVGWVDTHGRSETQAQIATLPVLPRVQHTVEGRLYESFDLDTVLKMRPDLVLLDELAHRNAPPCRHPKRYLDLAELLEAGLDVYSTLNIQHLESLNAVVAAMTQQRVQETVPDSVLDGAEIELIDLTPSELQQRLKDGKIYGLEGGQRALSHYFSTVNLMALRELALRTVAERVDSQLLQHRHKAGIRQVWPIAETLLVCVNGSDSDEDLLRHTLRMAERLGVQWRVLHLENPTLPSHKQQRINHVLRQARDWGADVVLRPLGREVARDILHFALEHNASQIVLGHSRRWWSLRRKSVLGRLLAFIAEHQAAITLHVPGKVPATAQTAPAPRQAGFTVPAWGRPYGYWAGLLHVGIATLIGLPLDRLTGLPNVSLVYLAVVVMSALRFGLWPSLFTALISSLCYNFFLIEPFYTFTIADPDNVLALAAFLSVAVITSKLSAEAREQADIAREQASRSHDLFAFARQISGLRKIEAVITASLQQLSQQSQRPVLMWIDGQFTSLPPQPLGEAEQGAAQWALDKGKLTGAGTDTLPGVPWLFIPLKTSGGVWGVMGVRPEGSLAPTDLRQWEAVVELAAIALERIRLAKQIDSAKRLAETEQLRSALLTSLSHDLRTPLAGMQAALASMHHEDEEQVFLLDTAKSEAERITRFVNNLLDFTRLNAGAVQVRLLPCEVREVVEQCLIRQRKLLAQHRVVVKIPRDFPLLMLDESLFEQVLVNLLDNAAKYAPEGSDIHIRAQKHRFACVIEVADHGSGLPEEDLGKIFDLFYRVQQADRQQAGTGLGLAICKGFIEAMGGRIQARNEAHGGAVFSLEFPNQSKVKTGNEAIPP